MECTDKYDFDTPIDRTNTQSLKWDVAENELPFLFCFKHGFIIEFSNGF